MAFNGWKVFLYDYFLSLFQTELTTIYICIYHFSFNLRNNSLYWINIECTLRKIILGKNVLNISVFILCVWLSAIEIFQLMTEKLSSDTILRYICKMLWQSILTSKLLITSAFPKPTHSTVRSAIETNIIH